jgi:hypothetical protein
MFVLPAPFFVWSAKSPQHNTSPTDTEWENIPATMNRAKELMVRTARSFGDLQEEQVAANDLRIIAWITSGYSKRVIIFFHTSIHASLLNKDMFL